MTATLPTSELDYSGPTVPPWENGCRAGRIEALKILPHRVLATFAAECADLVVKSGDKNSLAAISAALNWAIEPTEENRAIAAAAAADAAYADAAYAAYAAAAYAAYAAYAADADAAYAAAKWNWIRAMYESAFDHGWDGRWLTSDVIGLSRAIWDGDFHLFPILADAMMDAGCEDERIIESLMRGPRTRANVVITKALGLWEDKR